MIFLFLKKKPENTTWKVAILVTTGGMKQYKFNFSFKIKKKEKIHFPIAENYKKLRSTTHWTHI